MIAVRTTLMVCLSLCTLAVGGRAGADKMSTGDAKTDGLMVAIQEKLKSVKTCAFRVRTLLTVEGEQYEILDDVTAQTPARMRVARVLAGRIRQTIVSDGSLMWRYDPEEKIVYRINMARVYRATQVEADADQSNPMRPFRALEWKSIRYSGTDTLKGEILRVFEAAPEVTLLFAELPDPPSRVRFSVHPEDGLVRDVRYFDAEDRELLSRRFEDLNTNVKVDEEQFEFVVPAGVHVMDVTDDIIDLIKTTKSALPRK
ncbi:MAG: hypothetical protein OXU79_04570 [Gemmatimonadota bacterium]|nr:hypothetical protein [Gemmatimonadota bacterium]